MKLVSRKGINTLRSCSSLENPIYGTEGSNFLRIPFPGCSQEDFTPAFAEGDYVPQFGLLGKNSEGFGIFAPYCGRYEGTEYYDHEIAGKILVIKFSVEHGMSMPPFKPTDSAAPDSDEIVYIAKRAGIIDETDGTPLYRKLLDIREKRAGMLLADAIEDECYQTSLFAQLLENGDDIGKGLELAAIACGIWNYRIAVNAPKEYSKGIKEKYGNAEVLFAQGKYPVRHAITDYYAKKGAEFIGAGACAQLYKAMANGECMTDCVVTVDGNCIRRSANLRVAIGTPVSKLIETCKLTSEPKYIIIGDMLNGKIVSDPTMPITASVKCILAMDSIISFDEHECTKCGRCAESCPQGLLPFKMKTAIEKGNEIQLEDLQPENCVECGVCSLVCPSGIDLKSIIAEHKTKLGSGEFNTIDTYSEYEQKRNKAERDTDADKNDVSAPAPAEAVDEKPADAEDAVIAQTAEEKPDNSEGVAFADNNSADVKDDTAIDEISDFADFFSSFNFADNISAENEAKTDAEISADTDDIAESVNEPALNAMEMLGAINSTESKKQSEQPIADLKQKYVYTPLHDEGVDELIESAGGYDNSVTMNDNYSERDYSEYLNLDILNSEPASEDVNESSANVQTFSDIFSSSDSGNTDELEDFDSLMSDVDTGLSFNLKDFTVTSVADADAVDTDSGYRFNLDSISRELEQMAEAISYDKENIAAQAVEAMPADEENAVSQIAEAMPADEESIAPQMIENTAPYTIETITDVYESEPYFKFDIPVEKEDGASQTDMQFADFLSVSQFADNADNAKQDDIEEYVAVEQKTYESAADRFNDIYSVEQEKKKPESKASDDSFDFDSFLDSINKDIEKTNQALLEFDELLNFSDDTEQQAVDASDELSDVSAVKEQEIFATGGTFILDDIDTIKSDDILSENSAFSFADNSGSDIFTIEPKEPVKNDIADTFTVEKKQPVVSTTPGYDFMAHAGRLTNLNSLQSFERYSYISTSAPAPSTSERAVRGEGSSEDSHK